MNIVLSKGFQIVGLMSLILGAAWACQSKKSAQKAEQPRFTEVLSASNQQIHSQRQEDRILYNYTIRVKNFGSWDAQVREVQFAGVDKPFRVFSKGSLNAKNTIRPNEQAEIRFTRVQEVLGERKKQEGEPNQKRIDPEKIKEKQKGNALLEANPDFELADPASLEDEEAEAKNGGQFNQEGVYPGVVLRIAYPDTTIELKVKRFKQAPALQAP